MDRNRRALLLTPLLLTVSAMGKSFARAASTDATDVEWIYLPGSPFGISWSMDYGFWTGKPAIFLPEVRKAGGGLAKIYLFWSQIEPQPGKFDWTAVDAFLSQIHSPDEALISVFSSSKWATRRAVDRLPPSPAKDLQSYYDFIHALVKRCAGKVRYWENDAEPNDPLYWSGTKEEFTQQLTAFYRAVKDADPLATVVLGGYDGIFFPASTGLPPIPGQEKNLAFFDYVMDVGRSSYDVFDLRLYINPYTIPDRVSFMREMMKSHGYLKPIICTEYDGPIFTEITGNGGYLPWLLEAADAMKANGEQPDSTGGTNVTRDRVMALYAKMDSLPPQTQMYMQGASDELDHRLMRMQVRDTVIRNVIALSAGVQKMIYWNLANDANAPDEIDRGSIWNLMYGKLSFAEYVDGVFKERSIVVDGFRRMANELGGVRSVTPVPHSGDQSIHLFRVQREGRPKLYVVWQARDAFTGEESPPVMFELPWHEGLPRAVDALGNKIRVPVRRGIAFVYVGPTPIYVEEA